MDFVRQKLTLTVTCETNFDGLAPLSKRKREESSDSSTEDNVTALTSTVKRVKKDPGQVYIVTRGEILAYFMLLEDPFIYDFLISDSCLLYSDKYLLAMVFAYFKRANFKEMEYTKMNFFLALFLANDMEEDEEDFKFEILPWALGSDWKKKVPSFLQQRDRLWAKMSYRAIVSSKCCEEVMSLEPNHWAWTRERSTHHSGAMRTYARDIDFCEPRGPHDTPRGPCDVCASLWLLKTTKTSEELSCDNSSYISSSNENSFDESSCCSSDEIDVFPAARFSMKGLRQTIDDNSVLSKWITED